MSTTIVIRNRYQDTKNLNRTDGWVSKAPLNGIHAIIESSFSNRTYTTLTGPTGRTERMRSDDRVIAKNIARLIGTE